MDIRQLKYFCLVAKNLNFTSAAKEAHLDQSSLSKQIADLEARIGVKLFIRNTRTVQLTAAGAELLKHAKEIVSKAETAINHARLAAAGSIGTLCIGFSGTMEQEKDKLPSFIKQFHQNYPNIDLSLQRYNTTPLIHALERGAVDVAFTFSYGVQERTGIKFITCPFYPDAFPLCGIVLPIEHPLANKNKILLEEVASEPFVIITKGEAPNYEIIERLFAAKGLYPNIVSETPVLENLFLLVETGMGLTILTKHTAAVFASPNLKFIEIDNCEYRVELIVAWKETNPNPLIQLFLESMNSYYNEKS